MRGLKRDRTASVIVRGHAFTQNLRRGHYELGVEARARIVSRTRSPNSHAPFDQEKPRTPFTRASLPTQRNRAGKPVSDPAQNR